MNDINVWTGTGRLTRDAESKFTQGGFPITTFSLANGERIKKGEQWEDYTNFLDCKLLGKTGESIAKYLLKGKQVAFTARLHQDRWEKDGQKQSKMVLMVESIQLLGSGDKGDAKPEAKQGKEEYEEDVPF